MANPHQVKPRKGHKTDKKDGWWLAHLLPHGMIQASFIPRRAIRELRDLTRRRKRLLDAGTSEKNRVQKMLEDGNVKLGNVLSDIFGVSGQLMLDALLEGKASAGKIAQHAKRRARKRIPEIVAALQQHRMSDHHRWMIRSSVEHMEFLEKKICHLRSHRGQDPGSRSGKALATVAELTRVQAVSADMEQFGDPGHLSSWAGVCPGTTAARARAKAATPPEATHGCGRP